MFPVALVCGNTYVLKPSELDPGATMMLMEMAKEAGVPNGAVNVIHGQKECEHDNCVIIIEPLYYLSDSIYFNFKDKMYVVSVTKNIMYM